MAENLTSFWRYLSANKIEIPIIQRDYAQGRDGKEYLRTTFLGNIDKALRHMRPYDSEPLKLDFVYGSNEDGKIQPLDGQQRLTTLWLLHWYIAMRTGRLADAAPTLRNFTYETRLTSREFCARLCDAANFTTCKADDDVSDFIRSRTWFGRDWRLDPTITSMLRTLQGHKKDTAKMHGDKKAEAERLNAAKDGIEKIFRNCDTTQMEQYWRELISDNSQIIFYQMPLKNFGLTDDLYIKMNARGKQLTFFENFKADLVGYITCQAEKEAACADSPWHSLADAASGIPIKLDTDWTYIFWDLRVRRDDGPTIDEIYFTFLNRIFWNGLFTSRGADGKYTYKTNDVNTERAQLAYSYLNDTATPEYKGLEPYLFAESTATGAMTHIISPDLLKDLALILDRYAIIKDKQIVDGIWDEDFHFIPKYTDSKGNVTNITQTGRIMFFAICKYLVEGEPETNSLRRWKRVVANLISGIDSEGRKQIRTVEAMRAAIEKISDADSHDIYAYLSRLTPSGDSSALGRQWDEEIEKAKKIVSDPAWEKTWENKIIEAESWGFAHGSIRYLFTNSEGKTFWQEFDTKFDTIKKYFRKDVSKDSEPAIYDQFRPEGNECVLLRKLIGAMSQNDYAGFENALWYRYRVFNNKASSWLHFLLNDSIRGAVHAFLLGLTPTTHTPSMQEAKDGCVWKRILYLLSQTRLIDFVASKLDRSYIRNYYHGHFAIYPSSTGVFLDTWHRDAFLATDDIDVDEAWKVLDTGLFYGNDIPFRYEGGDFLWGEDDHIYLTIMENGYPQKQRKNLAENIPDDEKYYRLNARDLDGSQIKQCLKSLAANA